jgi:hypothetical protein
MIFTFVNLHKTWFPDHDHDASKHASLYCVLSSILTPDSTNGTLFAFDPYFTIAFPYPMFLSVRKQAYTRLVQVCSRQNMNLCSPSVYPHR